MFEEQLKKSCWFKYKYISKQEALEHGKMYNRERNSCVTFKAYKCNNCGKWHLTSRQDD